MTNEYPNGYPMATETQPKTGCVERWEKSVRKETGWHLFVAMLALFIGLR